MMNKWMTDLGRNNDNHWFPYDSDTGNAVLLDISIKKAENTYLTGEHLHGMNWNNSEGIFPKF